MLDADHKLSGLASKVARNSCFEPFVLAGGGRQFHVVHEDCRAGLEDTGHDKKDIVSPDFKLGRIYVVEPMGPIENDPNLTDKKFPGNPTNSFRDFRYCV